MKKLINIAMASVLGLSVVGVSQASPPSNQGSGTVTFTGRVIDAPCGIDAGSTNKVVDFGDLTVSELEDGKKKSVPFSIKLENCDIASLKAKPGSQGAPKNTVKIAFTGATVAGKSSMLSTSGDTEVGIMISTLEGGKYVEMNGTPVTAASFMNGKGEISLEAEAQQASDLGVLPGSFSATATFALSYE